MTQATFMEWAKQEVYDYALRHRTSALTGNEKPLYLDDVFIVWYCKTLQNHKALLSTPLPDGMYYEFTYNGDKDEAYLDAYRKVTNVVVKHD